MRHRNAGKIGAQGSAECAGCISLDDDEYRSLDRGTETPRHQPNVLVRVRLSGTVELHRRKAGEPESRGIEARMLTGEDDPRTNATVGKCFCNG
jgi:hypothetical protein